MGSRAYASTCAATPIRSSSTWHASKAELTAAGGDAAPADLRSMLVARNNYAAAEHKAVTDLYVERVGPLANLRLAEHLDGESRDCLIGSSIVRTGVVNEGAVVFFLRGARS